VTKRTRTEVSFEIQEEVAIRTYRISMADCPECRVEVRMIPANQAALIAKVTARDIYHRVSMGELHFTEDAYGLLYVCSESLRNLRTAESNEMARATDSIE
jgi:hypothetical protein